MTFLTWNPWRELNALRREVERAFEQHAPNGGGQTASERSARSYPYINLSEDKDYVYIEALAPGVDPESLEISIGPARGLRDTVRIAGEKQPIPMAVKPEAYHRNERLPGKFIRTITLPVEVDADKMSADRMSDDKITADYANGVLLIKLAKAEAAKPRQIEVKIA